MAVDKSISVEPNEVGLGQKVEVIPFKPRPGSPFSAPEGIFDKPKPGVKPEDDKKINIKLNINTLNTIIPG